MLQPTKDNHFGGDGRCDLPGYSAKYGTYSLLSAQLNKVIDFHVVHVSTVENSSRMEVEGLKLLLQKYHDITIDTLTTDRHVQFRAFLKKDYPLIVHQSLAFWKIFKEETYCSSKEEEDQRRTFTLNQINR